MYRLYQSVHRFGCLFLISFTLCWVFNITPWQPALLHAQSVSNDQNQVQQGITQYEAGHFEAAITIWQQALPKMSEATNIGIVHNNLAQAYRQMGQLSRAIAHWQQAIDIYRRQDNASARSLQLAGLLTEQGQTYSDLGQHKKAIELLQSAIEISHKHQDRSTEAAALGALGNAYWALGNYDQALFTGQKSLELARELNNPQYITTALNNLGNVYASRLERYRYQAALAHSEEDEVQESRLTQLAQQDTAAALQSFEQSVQESQALGGIAAVKALLNLNRLRSQLPANTTVMAADWERANALLEKLPDSRDKAYALINLALNFHSALGTLGDPPGRPYSTLGTQHLALTPQHSALLKAIAVAKNTDDARAASFALGSLGHLYELSGQYDKAMQLTQQAQFAAQEVNAADSLYRWQWQAGRLLKATGNHSAIRAYEQAIATLQNIRGDLIAANKDLQFDFRDSVEPVYREVMSLLLDPAATGDRAKNLAKVIDNLELLKLAELQNFFGDECVQVAQDERSREAGLVDSKAAFIYSVILEDRSEMILRLPDGSVTGHTVQIGKQQMQQDIDQLRHLLEKRSTDEYLAPAQKIYDALIRPLESDLASTKHKTLVFIQDGVLRQVPISSLHDGQKFLIQKYPIATTPSLSLTTAKALNRDNLHALVLGLSVERPPFSALTHVQDEVAAVHKILGGTELLNQDFTLTQLQAHLLHNSYPIVHMATHGRFGVDTDSTFLLGFDSHITLEQIDNLLRSRRRQPPVELLTLSACETAVGDNRTALGIAGVAVRAGVKSALASLWYIDDEATVPLIEEFYTQLRQPGVTKAEALRTAQLKMIANEDYNDPALWSPFILIGNWL